MLLISVVFISTALQLCNVLLVGSAALFPICNVTRLDTTSVNKDSMFSGQDSLTII